MKTKTLFVVLVLLFGFYSCEKDGIKKNEEVNLAVEHDKTTTRTQTSYFDGTEGDPISYDEAVYKIDYWKQSHDTTEGTGVFLGKEIIYDILEQDGCVGITFNYASDSTGNNTLVAVGTDKYDQDIYTEDGSSGIIADRMFQYPCTNCWYCNCLEGKKLGKPKAPKID